jgi:TPR repeat protein
MHFQCRSFFIQANLALTLALTGCHPMKAYSEPFTAQSDLALLKVEGVLPRNINLKTFEPHRENFTCVHAVTKTPALRPEAQALFEEGMALTSPALWPNERNWPRAMQLWQQASQMDHWKAAIMWIQTAQTGNGLNSEKGQFQVPPQDHETVVKQVEALMRLGVADGFYLMGNFHESGYGVKGDIDRAWAFWELAADLGSARAQTYIGKSLGFGDKDQERQNVAEWANQKVQSQMLECAYAQGYGPAAYKVGQLLNLRATWGLAINDDKEAQFARARQVLQDAVKFGSEEAANYLAVAFSGGKPMVGNVIDKARYQRYSALGDALFNNPDLRFPNLDKVLPLPPAKLPPWDSNTDTLIEAAKGVRARPAVPAQTSRYQPSHPAYIPPGHVLQVPRHLVGTRPLPGFSHGLPCASAAGYWEPKLVPLNPHAVLLVVEKRKQLAGYPPLRFEKGETMHLPGMLHEGGNHGQLQWHYCGIAVAQHIPTDWFAQAGTVRAVEVIQAVGCKGDKPCPATGIWQPYVLDTSHPLHTVFGTAILTDAWRWQAFIQEGHSMPSLEKLGIEDAKVGWRLMQVTELGFEV